jgi:phosphoserine phosphatase
MTSATTDLVLQAPSLDAADVAAVAAASGANGIQVLDTESHQAFRLTGAQQRESVIALCAAKGIDGAFVPSDRTRDRVRVVAIDMDSTLITIECIDEIAEVIGMKPDVAAMTAAAMRGEIDFAESLARRVALFTGLPVAALQRVYDERLELSPGAERMLAGFRAVGARTLLVSGGFTFFTDKLEARLGFDETAANELEVVSGRLTGRLVPPILDAQAKAACFSAMRERYATDGGIAVAIGDGANDLPMLAAADVSIAYHGKPIVRAQATHAIERCGLDAVLNLFA